MGAEAELPFQVRVASSFDMAAATYSAVARVGSAELEKRLPTDEGNSLQVLQSLSEVETIWSESRRRCGLFAPVPPAISASSLG